MLTSLSTICILFFLRILMIFFRITPFKHPDFRSGVIMQLSLIKNNCNENSEVDCFQLRGLCVYNEFQNYGIGTKIIHKIENIISEMNIKYVWMNARESAVKFYLNLGYTNSNKSKIIGNIGLHYMLYKYL